MIDLESLDKEKLINIINLLSQAFKARTKQVNWLNLLYRLESNQITEGEYDKEIDDNEEKYVLECNSPSTETIQLMVELIYSGLLGDVKQAEDDFYEIFELNSIYITDLIKRAEENC